MSSMHSRSACLRSVEDGEGVLVAVVVQGVVQAHAFGGEEAVAVEEGGSRLQGGRLTPAQDVVENESQQAVVGPLAPFEQQDLAGSEEHHPTCRMLRAEDAARDDVIPKSASSSHSGGGASPWYCAR